jgi:hypothetical protein
MAHDCFISYARADQELARQLKDHLEAEGIQAWWDGFLQRTPGAWRKRVSAAINASRALVVVVTVNASESDEVLGEVELARTARKVVIPLFVGRVPTTGGLPLAVNMLQRVSELNNSIQRETVQQLAKMIPPAPPEDRTPAIELGEIPLKETDVPRFGDLGTALHRACQAYFRDSVIKGNLVEAERIVSEMKSRSILVTPVDRFEAAVSWIQWVSWYETYARQARTWGELAKDLHGRSHLQPESPESFSRLCPPVAKQMQAVWQDLVSEWARRFLDAIVQDSWEQALGELKAFPADLLRPFDNIIVGVKDLSGAPEGTFQRCGDQVVAWYRSRATVEHSTGGDAHSPFPPGSKALERLRADWSGLAEQTRAVTHFLELLRVLVPPEVPPTSSQRQLIRMIESSLKDDTSVNIPDFESFLESASSWNTGLDLLVSTGLQLLEMPRCLKAMEQAGVFFATARKQAELIKEYANRGASYAHLRDSMESEGAWPSSLKPAAEYMAAITALRQNVAVPWVQYLETAQAETRKASNFVDHLEALERRLAREDSIFRALELLRANRTSAARELLQELVRGDDLEGRTVASAWMPVCEAFEELQKQVNVLSFPPDGLPQPLTPQELREIPSDRWTQWLASAGKVSELLAEARIHHPIFKAFPLESLDAAIDILSNLRTSTEQWNRLSGTLATGDIVGTWEKLGQLSANTPFIGSAIPAITSWAQAEKKFSDWIELSVHGRWEDSAARIEQLCAQYALVSAPAGSCFYQDLEKARQSRLEQLGEEVKKCRSAISTEKDLRQALDWLEKGEYAKALGRLEGPRRAADSKSVPEELCREIVRWHEVAGSASEVYRALAGVEDFSFEALVNAETGLPLELSNKNTRERLDVVLALAGRCGVLAAEARTASRFQCNVRLPDQGLGTYLTCVREVLDYVSRAAWEAAASILGDYMASQSDIPPVSWRLLKALERCRQRPSTSSLQNWLTTPLPALPSQSAAEASQGSRPANYEALLAALGAVEEAAPRTPKGGVRLPVHPEKTASILHNLGVAVFSRLQSRPAGVSPEYVELAIGVGALFACCDRYREFIGRAFGEKLPRTLETGSRTVRGAVRAQVQGFFEAVGITWGPYTDAGSWACRWEVESHAVTEMTARSAHVPLHWPYGPCLIRYLGLQKELGKALASYMGARPWYGPCGAGKSMSFNNNPEAALRCLPKAEECTAEQAAASAGYCGLPDPLKSLCQDANTLRVDTLLFVLDRDRFQADATPEPPAQIAQKTIELCDELLKLDKSGAQVEEAFGRTLSAVFSRIVEQVEQPKTHLARELTASDCEVRKQFMDCIIDFLTEKITDCKWLQTCVAVLRSHRSDLLRKLVMKKFELWKQSGEPPRMAREMLNLADQAVQDDPWYPTASILKAGIMLLPGTGSESEVQDYLRTLQSSAASLGWPARVAKEIQEYVKIAEGKYGQESDQWIRSQLSKGREERNATNELW